MRREGGGERRSGRTDHASARIEEALGRLGAQFGSLRDHVSQSEARTFSFLRQAGIGAGPTRDDSG